MAKTKKNPYAKDWQGGGISTVIPKDPATQVAQKSDKASAYADKNGGAFFGEEGKQLIDSTAGATQLTTGILRGDKDQIVAGGKKLITGVGSALSAKPLRDALKGPAPSYYGGSKEAGAAMQARDYAGILAGQEITGMGVDAAGAAINMAGNTYNNANTLGQVGMDLGGSGIGQQNAALNASIGTAGQQVGSLTEAMARQQTEAQARQMVGQAASARGGNQAAAIRGAQQVGAQQAAATNQQLALLRLQEEQDRRAGLVQAQQFAAGQYGGQAQLGYSTAGGALDAMNAATGQVNQAGSTIGQMGTTTTGQFLDAETERNKAQLAADQATQEAKSKHKAGLLKGLSSGVSSMFGG